MYAQKLETLPPPPGVFGSLKAGFDVVSTHVLLILLPLVLDLFLWLGPRLSVSKVMGPLYTAVFNQIQSSLTSSADMQRLTSFRDVFSELLQRFNLLSLVSRLQTFPIGISSLLAKTMPADSPLGNQNILQASSALSVFAYMFLLVLFGWLIGGLYFRWVSGIALGSKNIVISPLRAILQTVLLSALWFVMLIALSIPVTLVLTLLTLISPVVASIGLFMMMLLSFWVIVPFFFVPHGIFVRGQDAFHSIFTSFRMARFTLPTSGMFVFTFFILSTGLDYLWSVPKGNSWMMLVGIGGHAFVSTALLAASFVYYRDMNAWLQKVLEELQRKQVPGRQI